MIHLEEGEEGERGTSARWREWDPRLRIPLEECSPSLSTCEPSQLKGETADEEGILIILGYPTLGFSV